MNWQDKTAVVTGASSGIGAATARQLAGMGMRVFLVARRLERLLGLQAEITSAGGRAEVAAADLRSEVERARVFEQVGAADVLVNNAGFGWYGYYSEMTWKTAREMLETNVAATAHLTSLFLPGMRARNRGHIINVGSISGSIPSQGVALYGATKSFLDNFTTALARELRGTRVFASVVRAGPVRTEFGETALNKENGGHVPTEKIGVTSEAVAWEIWKLLLRPRRVIYVPRWLQIVPWAELSFGWIIDRIGPLLLKRQGRRIQKA
ncbi:MAG: SDR family NAD(P)-dependent oxidoreductase [Chloroflexi bacterium]|nr:SDR family NAD(P)-dependent oxidoreductase [Chloroflexota bacterium]